LQIAAGTAINLGFMQLQYHTAQLQDVEITGRIAQSYKSDYSFALTKTQSAVKDMPQSVSTVTKELMKDKMAMHLVEVLDDVPGVCRYSGFNEYSLRGLHAQNPPLINGLRAYNSQLTNPMLVNLERIEILKGPTSVLYGNTDPGGTVNLVTKKPLQQHEHAIDILTGSWNNFRAQGDVTRSLNTSKNLLYRLNAGYENKESFRNQYFAKSFQVAPSFSFVPNDRIQLNLDISVTHTNTVADRGQPGFEDDNNLLSTPIQLMVTQPGDYLKETNVASILSFSYKLNKHISFNSAYLNYITRQQLSEHGIEDFITDDSVYLYYTNRTANTTTNTFTNYFNFTFNTGKINHQLLAGYDYIKNKVDFTQWNGEDEDFGEETGIVGTFSLKNPVYFKRPVDEYEREEEEEEEEEEGGFEAEQYYTHGIYIQEQLSIDKWKILASLRQEIFRSTGDDEIADNVLMPRVGIVYALAPNVNIYSTYNRGFDPFEPSARLQVFNEPFKPVLSEMFETGVKADLFNKKLSGTFAVYQVTLDNVVVNANDPFNPDLYTQRGRERAKGFEAEANGNILPNLAMSLSYAYNNAKIIESVKPEEVDIIKENAPLHMSSSRFKYNFTKGILKGFGISAGHTQVGRRNTFDANLQLPAYCILNAGVQYSFSRFIVACNLNNIANTNYFTADYNNISKWPGAPRNFMLRVGYHF
jgi:iron complex outermembrane recepter protein